MEEQESVERENIKVKRKAKKADTPITFRQ
jgi:hypothetical protein